MGAMWYEITGDSWIVDVRVASVGPGAGGYLAKYLIKGNKQRSQLEAMGFIRRYTRSRGFPAGLQMRRRGTVEKAWARTGFAYGKKFLKAEEEARTNPLFEQVGTDMAKVMAEERKRLRMVSVLEGFGNAGNNGAVRAR